MSLGLTATFKAVAPNITSSFLGTGGTPPYTYSVLAGGAGGTINASTGVYTAPAVVNGGSYLPSAKLYDTVQVQDSLSAVATFQILVGTVLLLFCDVLQTQLGLTNGRVYLWDQKLFQPTDSGLYIAVSELRCKPFGNVNTPVSSGGGLNSVQSVNMYSQLQIDVISRDTEARDRKEEIIMALDSDYARLQQTANGFYIGKLPPGAQFVNLSQIDGAAIPYRYSIAASLQYAISKTSAVPYFNTFSTPQVITNP